MSVTTVRELHREGRVDDFRVVRDLRRDLAGFARGLGATRGAQEAVALAVSEAVTNVVKHAYVGRPPGDVRITAGLEAGGRLVVTVSDDGRGMVPRTTGVCVGLGLRLMTYLSDDVKVTNRGVSGGTTVWMRFSLDRAEPSVAPHAP